MGPMERRCSIGPSIRVSLFLQKFIAQKKHQQRFIYCEQPKLGVWWFPKMKYIELETGGKQWIFHWSLNIFTADLKPNTLTQSNGETISRKSVVAI